MNIQQNFNYGSTYTNTARRDSAIDGLSENKILDYWAKISCKKLYTQLQSLYYRLAKVKHLHPGADDLVRVVTVQTPGNHELKRPLSKLILLPKEKDYN